MIQSRPQQQMVNVVLIRFKRRFMLFDTGDTDADGVEDRNGQNTNSDRRGSIHVHRFRYNMVRIDFAEMEDKSGQQIA